MEADRAEAVGALLVQAEEAHGAYETTELNGVLRRCERAHVSIRRSVAQT